MNLYRRPLQGRAVGLSVSESPDSAAHGFPSWRIDQVVVQVVAALFGQGVAIVFGHDWRDDGVMETVHGLAMRMQPVMPPHEAGATPLPLLHNVLPWPDRPKMDEEDLKRLATTLHIERAGLPPDLEQYTLKYEDPRSRDSDQYRFLRARALTELRQLLDQKIQARICLGGQIKGSQGRYPGIIEEAFLAVLHQKPLYLCGILGGATQQVIDAIEGREMPPDFCSPEKMRVLYREFGATDGNPASDVAIEPEFVWHTFRNLGPAGLARLNHLSEDQNATLFRTLSLDQAIELILLGLGKPVS